MRRSRLLAVLLVLTTLSACGSPTTPAPTTSAPAPSEAPTAAIPEVTTGRIDPDLPGPAALVVGTDRLVLASGARLLTLTEGRIAEADVRGGANGFLVPAIVEGLGQAAPTDGPIVLEIDPRIPHRTVTRVIYSVAQTSRPELRLRVRRGATIGVVPISLPRFDGAVLTTLTGADRAAAQAADEAAATLAALLGEGEVAAPTAPAPAPAPATSVPAPSTATPPASAILPAPPMAMIWLRPEGVRVSTSAGDAAPGCERVEPGALAVRRTAGAIDVSLLGTCLAHVHAAQPDTTTVTITASPDGTFGELAQVLAVARGTDTAPLFTTTLLSAGVE